MKYAFPAIFEEEPPGYCVYFPDDDSSATSGQTIKEAVEMATDSLNLTLWRYETEGLPIPKPTPLEQVELKDNQLVRLIYADTEAYAEVMRQLNENPIKYAAQQAQFTTKELADFLGAPYRTVQDWLRGVNRPPKYIEDLIYNHILDAKWTD